MTTIVPAHELIGHEGQFRLPGGRAIYSDVMYDDVASRSDRPRLARLDSTPTGLRQINRWVDWEQPVEVLRDFTAEYEAEQAAELARLEKEWDRSTSRWVSPGN
jgi:hypothetical protein